MPLDSIARPGTYDLVFVAGDSFRRELLVREQGGSPIDLTGLVARAQIRNRPNGTILATITTSIPTPTNGIIIITMDATQTRALPGSGKWDIELDGGITNLHTILAGGVKVIPDITQA